MTDENLIKSKDLILQRLHILASNCLLSESAVQTINSAIHYIEDKNKATVMTLDEVCRLPLFTCVWMEKKCDDHPGAYALSYMGHGKFLIFPHHYGMPVDEYGFTYRIWKNQPTIEQMMKTPWEVPDECSG